MTRPAFISLGSNIEPERNLPAALRGLLQLGNPLAASQAYQNPALGPSPQPDFINAAVLLATDLSPVVIRQRLRSLESDLQRVRTHDKYAARTIDLDLCFLGDLIMSEGDLTLPDPDLLVRAHLAIPMAELDPDFTHPATGETLASIADRLRDTGWMVHREDVSAALQRVIYPDPPSG